MKWAMLMVFVVSGCRATAPVGESVAAVELLPADSVRLARPAVGLWFDGEDVLVLEASGTRIIRLSVGLSASDTIPLTTRLVGPQGIRSDGYYYYVYDQNTVYRMARDELVMSVWLSNVRLAGMASYAPAEALVADSDRRTIWYKGFGGESRQFTPAGTLRRPGAIAAVGGGAYCVIDDKRELLLLNRLGIVTGSRTIPVGTDLLAADSSGCVWVGQTGVTQVLRIDVRARGGRVQKNYRLAGASSPVQLVAGPRLAVLDAGNRILVYELP